MSTCASLHANFTIRLNRLARYVDPIVAVYRIDPVALSLLAELVERIQAKVVISSSWRETRDADAFDRMFTAIMPGWNPCVIGVTPVTDPPGNRGKEIALWLSQNRVDNYVILDDMSRDNFTREQWPHQIEVNSLDGLLLKDVSQALQLLGAKSVLIDSFGKPKWRLK